MMQKKNNLIIYSLMFINLIVFIFPVVSYARTEWQGANCGSVTTVALNSSTPDSITVQKTTNYYGVNVTAPGTLVVYTKGKMNTYGYLRNSSCNKLAEHDNIAKKNKNFRITYDVTTAGMYYIAVENSSKKKTGSYTLYVDFLTDDYGDNCTDSKAVAPTSITAGNIETSGDIDYFKVVIPNVGKLKVYTTGTTDTRGRYYNTSCNQQKEDNNSGSTGLNFQFEQNVTAGTYYYSVEENGNNDTGTYDLHVEFTSTVTWTITSSITGGLGGTISPSGTTVVSGGGSQSYTMTPSDGNTINDVKVDGASQGALSSYSFSGVSADHSIEVTFQVPAHLCADLSDIPLDTKFRAAPANIMFVLDDSGSMDWEFMTDENDGLFWAGSSRHYYLFDNPGDNVYYGTTLSRGTDRKTWKTQWAGYNKLYYNPQVEYVPWPTLSNADPDFPRSHPKIIGNTLNMDGSFDTIDTGAVIIDDNNTSQFLKSPNNEPITIDNEDAEFTIVQEPASSALRIGEYSNQAWESTYRYTNINGQYIVKWTPTLLAGNYDVNVKWHADSNNSTSVTYTIDQGGGITTSTEVDQSTVIDGWVSIATDIPILAGSGEVTLSHNRTSDTERAVADAVQFIPTDASWETASNSDAYDNDYYYTPLVVDTDYPEDGILDEIFPFYAAAWLPDLVGDYTIYARWVGGADRSSAVTYTVKDIGGTIPVTVDQTTNGGTWQQLGAGTFTLNAASYILLTHTQSAADNTVAVADAIKLVPAASSTITINRSHYYIWSDTDNKPYLVVLDGSTSKILYYSVNEQPTGTDGVVEEGELNLLAGDPPDDVKTDRTYTEERQNFANWYSFYRKRELTAAAAISRTIDQMQGVYVGLNTINHRIQQPALGVKAGGVDETTTLLNLLYNLTIKSNGTPLRRGLRDIGRYYDQDDNIKLNGSSGNDSPFASSADGGECQQAFTIAMTDGYYNGSSPYVGNQDAADSENPTFAGSPYADGYSDTLADVAMKYYKEDLCDGLANSIQGNEMDSATHQHMVTYGVSFGVTGNLVSREENPATYDYDFTTPLDPANPVYPTWPNPSSGDQEKIDDLMHASFNGRGLFLSASNPDDLIDSLLTILKDVELRIGSASSVSVNGDELYEEVSTALRIFQSSYDSENWSGNVQSFGVNSLTAEVETNNPFWHARDELQDQDWNTGRMIATYDGSNGITFRYSSLTADMETMLDSNATTAGNILNYVRGDNSNETEEGGAFRDRIYKLGDIVHSSPAYKHGILYVGGNDGMLHAFYSEDDAGNSIEGGEEFFAYVPNLVFENLYKLKDTTYTHQYYVDLTPKVSDVEFTAGGNDITTLLVGGLGKGGKGYFALNISAPDPMDPYKPPSITNETTLAEKVLWEYPNASTPTSTKTITNATNAGPIVITTASAHGFSTGDSIEIANVLGNTAANERWIITSMTATTFSLDGSTGSGAYASGGSAIYTESDSLGYTYSRPNILKSNYNDGDWVVIFGNGYNSPNGHAVLFILDPVDGTLIRKIDTGAANAGSPKCNGLSTPIAIDLNHDSQVDYLYAGDLQGNMWKFDLTSSNPSEWESAYKDTSGTPKPVFQALGPGGLVQPITTRPDVMSMSSANQDGQLILFATGKYIGENDSSDTNIQTIYGIWDYGDDWDDQEYLGSFTRGATPLSNQPATVSLLEQTEIVSVDTYTVGSTTQYDTDYTTAEDTVDDAAGVGNNFNRLNTPVTAVTVDDYKPNPDNHVGWYFDLPITSERVVTDPLVRGGNAIVISYIPNDTPCSASGDSVINEINAVSGARLEETPWDIDENGTIDPPEYDSDGNLTGTGDYLIYDSTAPDSTTAMGTIADRNANETDVYIVAPSRIKKAGRLMSPAIATLPDGDELKIMSSSTANAATQNITTVREAGTTFGIRYWFESQQ